MERGFSLLSLAVVLSVFGLVLAATLPRVALLLDRFACHAAREALIAKAERARSEASRHGAAQLIVDADSARIWVEVGGVPREVVDLGARYGVRVLRPNGGLPIRLRFDRLGIGRFASRTFELGRGAALTSLTVSSYGRLRR